MTYFFVAGISGCSYPKDLGPRGDARLYLDAVWPMEYPRLELNSVPLDHQRTYTLHVKDWLEGWNMHALNLEVVAGKRSTFGKELPKGAVLDADRSHPVIRVRVLNQKRKVYLDSTVGNAQKPWVVMPGDGADPTLKSHVSGREQHQGFGRSFTVTVQVVRPSATPAKFLRIYGP